MTNKIMTFSIENIELSPENLNTKEFSLLKVDAFATGVSHHNTFVTEETLQRTAKTILQKPFVFKISELYDDLMSHEKDEYPGGFVPHNSRLEFKKLEDGRTMLSVDVLIWKRYSQSLLDYFQRDGKKGVSVEIEILESKEDEKTGLTELIDFCYSAITGLGDLIQSAIPNAQAVLAFSKEFNEAKKEFDSSNKADIVEDNYLGIENQEKNKEINFSLNSSQILELFNTLLSDNKYGDNWRKYWAEAYDECFVYIQDYEDGKTYRIPFTFEENNISINMDEKEIVIHGGYKSMAEIDKEKDDKKVEDEKFSYANLFGIEDMAKMFTEEEDDDDDVKEEFAKAKVEYAEGKNPSAMMSAMFTSMKRMQAKMAKAEADKEVYMAENEELKKKFAEIDEEKKQFSVAKFLKGFADKFEVTPEQVEELKEKSKEFSLENINQWENHCKAFSYDLKIKEVQVEDKKEEDDDIKIYSFLRDTNLANLNNDDVWSKTISELQK